MKKLINDVSAVVPEMLDGLAALNPGLSLLQGGTIIVRADAEVAARRGEVALISGGGSGHEPAHAGYVGAGMLSATVAGEVFTSPSTDAVLAPHRERFSWDAPIHSIADIEALAFPPKMVNIKPSRIGALPRLCATYDYCAERGIGAYGGGQTELGPGRGQAQYLAALFHPDTPNDLAPSGYNAVDPPAGLPASPLVPVALKPGFRWDATGPARKGLTSIA